MQDFLENNALWDFAVRLYSDESTAGKLLQLQDDYGLNVNILLSMVWAGLQGKKLDSSQVTALVDAIKLLDSDIIQNLRTARRSLKAFAPHSQAYLELKRIEIDCEHLLLDLLFGILNDSLTASCPGCFADENVDLYCDIVTGNKKLPEALKRFYPDE